MKISCVCPNTSCVRSLERRPWKSGLSRLSLSRTVTSSVYPCLSRRTATPRHVFRLSGISNGTADARTKRSPLLVWPLFLDVGRGRPGSVSRLSSFPSFLEGSTVAFLETAIFDFLNLFIIPNRFHLIAHLVSSTTRTIS